MESDRGSASLPLSELLDLSRRLERCWSLGDLLDTVAPTVDRVLGYPHSWLAVFGQVPGMVTVISHATAEGLGGELLRKSQAIDIPIAGDPFLAEILAADHVVVVEDATTDPRTNKAVVAALGNQTIINVPLILADEILGTLGLGTFGDEGVRPPMAWHLEFLAAIAGHVSVALDRVNFLEQRKRIQESLSQEKEHLRVTLASIGDAVIATDLQGLVTRINPTAVTLTGWSEADALGRPLAEVFSIHNSTTGHPLVSPVDRVLAEGRVVGLANHTTLVSRQGRSYQIADSAAPIRDSQGVPLGVVMVFRDVTEDYSLRDALARTSALLERTAAAAKVGGWEWDLASDRLRWSKEACRLLGQVEPGPTSWEAMLATVAHQDRAIIRGAVAQLASSGGSVSVEVDLDGLAGQVPVRFQGFADEEGGRRVRAFGTLQDLSEQRAGENRRRDLERQLFHAQKMESLGLLAGGVAHDMNNMLAAISGIASVQLMRAGPSGASSEAFSTILTAVGRGRALTSSLLSHTRRSPAARGPVNWNALMTEVQSLLEHSTLSRVVVTLTLEPNLPDVDGDAGSLEQVLVNLCVNAVDAMDEVTGARQLRLSTRSTASSVEVEVSDTGKGMDPAVLAQAQVPFFTTKPQGRGTGLGLALATSTLQAHGGTLAIESTLGTGTTVRLSMPRRPLPVELGTDAAATPGTAPRIRAVLVVDDDDLVRTITLELLQALGLVGQGVPRAEAALGLVRSGQRFDRVLLDVNMPGMGGLQALKELKSLDSNAVIVLTTGLADQGVVDLVERTPGLRLLTKPFTTEELKRAIG